MCNNLLQYAHVYAWGREHGRKVISMRFSYKYRYFKISHSNLVSFPLYLLAKVAAALRILPTACFDDENCDKAALERKMLGHRNIVVAGWYVRYYDLFLKYRQEICDLFSIDNQYTAPVLRNMMPKSGNVIRLGVHIRRGDYALWSGGKYCYDDKVFVEHIKKFCLMFPDKDVHVYLSSNDPSVNKDRFCAMSGINHIFNLRGVSVSDLYMLSECDYLIGPPSTFSLVASMYRDIPLYRMDVPDTKNFSLDSFRKFDYWFRRIV